jgi:hypothetical protein
VLPQRNQKYSEERSGLRTDRGVLHRAASVVSDPNSYIHVAVRFYDRMLTVFTATFPGFSETKLSRCRPGQALGVPGG